MGCGVSPITIYYDQYGACVDFTTGNGAATSYPYGAYVEFDVSEINNPSTQTFNFDPNKLYVQQNTQHFADSTLIFYRVFFGPFGAVPGTFGPATDALFQIPEELVVVVSTSAADGAVEANSTAYSLYYAGQPTDPPVTMVKTNASWTNWTVNENCCSMGLAICN